VITIPQRHGRTDGKTVCRSNTARALRSIAR